MRPGKLTPAHTHFADGHDAPGIVNMQLQPAQALEVEALEPVDSLSASEPGPGIEVHIQERRAADLVRLVHQQLDDCAGRCLDSEARPAHDLFGQLEG